MKALKKTFPVFESSPFLSVFFSLSVSTFIFGLILFALIYFSPGTKIINAEVKKWAPVKGQSVLGVNIANTGMIFLKGAQVVSVSETTIVVKTSWKVTKMQWVIHTEESYLGKRHFGTNFFDFKGNRLAITDVAVGSIISISGLLDTSYAEPTVDADFIRILR